VPARTASAAEREVLLLIHVPFCLAAQEGARGWVPLCRPLTALVLWGGTDRQTSPSVC